MLIHFMKDTVGINNSAVKAPVLKQIDVKKLERPLKRVPHGNGR